MPLTNRSILIGLFSLISSCIYACSSEGDNNTGSNQTVVAGSGGASVSQSGVGASAASNSGAGSGGASINQSGAGASVTPVSGAGGDMIPNSGSGGGSAGGNTAGQTAGNGGVKGGAISGTSGGAAGIPGGEADAGTEPADSGSNDTGADTASTTSLFPSVTDLENAGPYTSKTANPSGPNNGYSLFYPQELARDGAKNPIVVWGSGGMTDPSWYTLLPHLASHGFAVIASNAIPGIGGEAQQGQDMIAGIEWLLAENSRSGGEFFDKLDTSKIAAVGYSMGSLATFTIADDPRLVTTVHISGGNTTAGRVNNLHAIAAFLCGDQPTNAMDMLIGDISRPNCDTDFQQATTPVFYGNFIGGSHLAVMTSPFMERIRVVVTGWLRWQLMNDQTLKPMFVGDGCEVCSDPNWTVQQKNLS